MDWVKCISTACRNSILPSTGMRRARMYCVIQYNNIAFTVSIDNADKALYIINSLRQELGAVRIDCDKNIAKVSLIGTGIMENPEIPAKMFAALTRAGVNIMMISSSEIRLSVIVAETDGKKALSAVHEEFFGV